MKESKRFNENILTGMIQEYGKQYQAYSENNENVNVFIMGSQSIWGTHNPPNKKLLNSCDLDCLPDYDLMEELGVEFSELDSHVSFCAGENTEKAENLYHGKFIDVVSDQTVHAPSNWKERVKEKTYPLENGTNITASFLDKHDLIISKIIAGRPKDIDYIQTLFDDNAVSTQKINRLLNSAEMEEPIKRKLIDNKKINKLDLNVSSKEILDFKQTQIADRLNNYIKQSFSNDRNKKQPHKKIIIREECFIGNDTEAEFPNNLDSIKNEQQKNVLDNKSSIQRKSRVKLGIKTDIFK
jgi:hypothetical protein